MPEVRKIFKIRTVRKPDVFLHRCRTFNTFKKREKKKYCFILQISILYLFTVNILILMSMLSIQKNIGLFLTPMLHDPNFNLQITSEEYCLHLKMDYPVVRGKRPITLTCPDARYKLLLNLRSYIKIS